MSLDLMVWSVKDAPTKDCEEHSVLSVMADEVNESGLGCLLATKTIARRAKTSDRTAQRRIDDMMCRGLIGYGDQTLARYIRADQRPTVYNLLMPYSAYSARAITRVNESRVARGLPPLTPDPCPTPAAVACGCPDDSGSPHAKKPETCPQVVRAGCGCPPEHGSPHRPDLADAPAKKRRADAGVKRKPAKDQVNAPEQNGPTTSHPVDTDGVTTSPPAHGVTTSPAGLVNADGVTSSPQRGVRKSPDPKDLDPEVLDPEKPPPTATSTEVAASEVDDAATGGDEQDSHYEPSPDERQTLTEALDAALTQRHADPRWFRKAVIEGMQAALAQGHPAAVVAAGIRRMALDPASRYPGRLPHFLTLDERAGDDGDAHIPEPKRIPSVNDRRCRRHPSELEHNCTWCNGEAFGADDGTQRLLDAGRLTAASARELAHAEAAAAGAKAREVRRRRERRPAETATRAPLVDGEDPGPQRSAPAEDPDWVPRQVRHQRTEAELETAAS